MLLGIHKMSVFDSKKTIARFKFGEVITDISVYLKAVDVSIVIKQKKEKLSFQASVTILTPQEDYYRMLGIKQNIIVILEKAYDNEMYVTKKRYQFKNATMQIKNYNSVVIEADSLSTL